jgi:hypothetical protein
MSINRNTVGAVPYFDWSHEELRGLAVQLQLPGASQMTRCELLDLLAGSSGPRDFPNSGKYPKIAMQRRHFPT